jgi:DNA processing protein
MTLDMWAPEERRGRAALSRLAEPDDAELGRAVASYGAAAVVASLRGGTPLLGDRLAASLGARLPRLDVDRDLDALAVSGGRLLCPGDEEWPGGADDLGHRAPLALWVRGAGSLAALTDHAVAIVGTRAASDYGVRIATDLGAELASRGWTVVSGGAYGIDACAHRGALAVGGTTVVVLASGVDVPYPRAHSGLFDAVLADGVVVSEVPPGSAAHRGRFLTRNRLIAAMSAGTVVVEAAVRSGARSTARHARDIGRPLMVVPGPVTSTTSAGCHELLRQDEPTTLVTGVAHVLEMVGRIGEDLAPVARGAVQPRDELPAEAARVLDAVPAVRPAGPAGIAATAGVPMAEVEAALGLLLACGLIEERAGGFRLARS